MKKLFSVRATILAGGLLLQLTTLCLHSHGAAGNVDLSFDPGSGVNGAVTVLALQSDGKVIIGGEFTLVKGLARTGIARLNADGSGDPGFDAQTDSYSFDHVRSVALQGDGKVLVNHDWGIVRLNSNGSLDNSFAANLYFPVYWDGDPVVNAIAVQPDGKIVVGGYFFTESGTNVNFGLARLNTDGSLDPGFNASSWEVRLIALQPDGKLLAYGSGFARYNTNGSQDLTFSPAAEFNGLDTVISLTVQPDAKLLVGGYFATVSGTNRNGIARLNANGTLDHTFNAGTGTNSSIVSVVVQPDGKVLIGGHFSLGNSTNRHQIARLNANGSADVAFDAGIGADSFIERAVLQSDGKVLIGGYFTTVNGTNRNHLARLNTTGTLDGNFNPGREISRGSVLVQPDGKVIVGNVRLNADGSLDNSYVPTNSPVFPADLSFPGSDYSIATCSAVQSDGKRLIGGYFVSSYTDPWDGGITRWNTYFLRRFNADASRDTNFEQAIGPADYGQIETLRALALQPDGKVLVGGIFTSMKGTNHYGIARLNANGTLDNGFNAGAQSVSSILLQADGRIFIAGGFYYVNGTSRGGIARLDANGNLDNSFNPGTGANGSVASFTFQPDGKLLIGGSFTTVNGTSRNRIARLNANGSLDGSFDPGTGANGLFARSRCSRMAMS
jgi:uncharacterized delta-60 repeat protein